MPKQKVRKAAIGNDRDFYEMANAVRTYYIMEYRRHVESKQGGGVCTYGCKPLPQWDGGVDADGRKHEPIWFKIVEYALTHKVSPILLLRGTFRAWRSPKPPFPNQFINQLALQRARELSEHPVVLKANLNMEDHRFKAAATVHQLYNHMDVDAAARRALHDPMTDLSALFRYCVGVIGGADDVAERFRHEAFLMYVFDRDAYDKAWGDRIPQELRDAADHFYREVLRCL